MTTERNAGNARLALAGRFAAAMLANPAANVYEQSGWKVHVCRDALDIADRLIAMHNADMADYVPPASPGILGLARRAAA